MKLMTLDKCEQIFNLPRILAHNEKIEDKLNVICVISNPCNYKRRIILAKIFIEHMLKTKNVNLFVVECIYPKLNQTYQITDSNNPNHLQLTADTILWTKENMINVAVAKLLPSDYKAFAFLDADLHFMNTNWADDTLKALNSCDILQPFENGYNLNKFNKIDNTSLNKKNYSICYLWLNTNNKNNMMLKNKDLENIKPEFCHPGWGWAITRTAYEKIGGIYDLGIIGGGDAILANSIMCKNYMKLKSPFNRCSIPFLKSLYDYQIKCYGLKVGYISGTVHHYYHGSLENRKYTNRWDILVFNNFNPYLFLTKNESGMYKATKYFPDSLENEIIKYFKERNEDS